MGVATEVAFISSLQQEGQGPRILPVLTERRAKIPLFLRAIQYLNVSDMAAGEERGRRLTDEIHSLLQRPMTPIVGSEQSEESQWFKAERLSKAHRAGIVLARTKFVFPFLALVALVFAIRFVLGELFEVNPALDIALSVAAMFSGYFLGRRFA